MEEKVPKQMKNLPSFITGLEDCIALDEEIQYKSKEVYKPPTNITNSLPKFKMDKALVCASCSQSFNDQLSYLRHMRLGHKYK